MAFSVHLPSVPVPARPKTSYVCMWVQPPQDRKYHIYSVRLVSPSQSEGMTCPRLSGTCRGGIPQHVHSVQARSGLQLTLTRAK